MTAQTSATGRFIEITISDSLSISDSSASESEMERVCSDELELVDEVEVFDPITYREPVLMLPGGTTVMAPTLFCERSVLGPRGPPTG